MYNNWYNILSSLELSISFSLKPILFKFISLKLIPYFNISVIIVYVNNANVTEIAVIIVIDINLEIFV